MNAQKRKKFAAREDEYLRAHYLELTRRELARDLGRTKSSVSNRMHKLGLLRPPEVRKAMSAKAQFQLGHASWNKGKRGIHLAPATEFKRGRLPHNAKHDGCIATRKSKGVPYQYIRVSLGKWELLHRQVWKQAHGKIPARHIVGFKDEDTMNCALENLYLMSCADNIRRNCDHVKAAASLRAVWKNMPHFESDKYVAAMLAQRDPALRKEILRQPDLIEMKRAQLKLRRCLREIDSPRVE